MEGEIKAIIFDLYDTLIFCPKEHKTNPFDSFLNDIGLDKEEARKWRNKVLTENDEMTFEEFKQRVDPNSDLDSSIYTEKLNKELKEIRLFEDTIETLERLKKKYRIFCLSNISPHYRKW